MNRWKRFFPFVLWVGMMFPFFSVTGQDLHFSQFGVSPMLINPAGTGHFAGSWRLTNQYRNQWSALSVPFRTLAVGIEKPGLFRKSWLAGGFFASYDETGVIGLRQTSFQGSLALNRNIGLFELRAGVQGGMVFKGILQLGTLPEQWDQTSGSFNPALPNSEQGLGESASYPEIHAGLLVARTFANTRFQGGMALFHIRRPDVSFTAKPDLLPLRWVVHGSVSFPGSGNLYWIPAGYFAEMAGVREWLLGTSVLLPVQANPWSVTGFSTGFHFRSGIQRNTDAVIVSAGVEFLKTRLGLSYDLNVSGLHRSTQFRGAFEISLVFLEMNSIFKPQSYPCTRY